MSEQIGLWRATYTPGDWVVLAGPTSLVILGQEPAPAETLLNDLWIVVVQADSLEQLVQQLAQYGVGELPDFAAFFWHNGQMRSLVRGALQVRDLKSGAVMATGEGVQTWTETGFGQVRKVRVLMSEDASAGSKLSLPLVVGAVWASAVDLDATEEARVRTPQQTAPPPPGPSLPGLLLPQPVQGPPNSFGQPPGPGPVGPGAGAGGYVGQSGVGAGPAYASPNAPTEAFGPGYSQQLPGRPFQQNYANEPPQRGPQQAPAYGQQVPVHVPGLSGPWPPGGQGRGESGADMVLAVTCPQNHPNPPEAQRCRRCAGPLQGQPRLVPRPVMALLRPSTGAPVEADRTILIGRSPQGTPGGRQQLPKLLTVPSPSHDISRTHLEVSPQGWELIATDLHSTNGTQLVRPGHPEPERMTPGEPVPVYPGCVLDLGDGVTILVDHPA